MWSLWLGARNIIPGVKLGGIFADTRGYHNTRARLQSWLPDNYSIHLDMDRRGPDDKGSAIDLTMSGSEMRLRTGYLRRSALHLEDTRLRPLREFIGTLDSSKVYCRIDGNAGLGQRRGVDDWTRDSTHLWHIHISILRAFCADPGIVAPILSVLAGQTWEQWKSGGYDMEPRDMTTYDPGDTSTGVRNQPFQTDYATNKTVQPRWAWEQAWAKAWHADDKLSRQVVPMLQTLVASHTGTSLEQVQAMMRAELDAAAQRERTERQAEYAVLGEQLAAAVTERFGSEAGRFVADQFLSRVHAATTPEQSAD
jgi:hypothetical protein